MNGNATEMKMIGTMARTTFVCAALVAAGAGASLLAAGGALAQPGFRPGPPPPGGMRDAACLRQTNIYDFRIVPGNRSLVVTDVARRRYRVNFTGKCYDLQRNFGLRFKVFGVGGLACVDRGDSVITRGGAVTNQCLIHDVQYQTPALDRADFEAAQAMRHR
jgi:hypothetical protein